MVTYIGSNGVSSGAATAFGQPVTFPAGTAAGHLALICYSHERGTLPPLPTGWTEIRNEASGTAATALHAYKFLTSGDLSTGSVTVNATVGRHYATALVVFAAAGTPTWVQKVYTANPGTDPLIVAPAGSAFSAIGFNVTLLSITARGTPWQYTFAPEAGWTELREQSSASTTSVNASAHVSSKAVTASGAQAAETVTSDNGNFGYFATSVFVPDSTIPPTASATVNPNFALVDLSGSVDGAGGALTYSCASPPVGTIQVGAKFAIPRLSTAVTYTFTVTEAGNGSVTTTAIVPAAGAGSIGYRILTGTGTVFA